MSDIFAEIVKLRKEGRKGVLATIIETQGSIPSYESSKILIRDDGSIVGTVGGGAWRPRCGRWRRTSCARRSRGASTSI